MNMRARAVELRSSKHTADPGALQKGEDFVKAFSLGFDTDDAIALLRLVSTFLRLCFPLRLLIIVDACLIVGVNNVSSSLTQVSKQSNVDFYIC